MRFINNDSNSECNNDCHFTGSNIIPHERENRDRRNASPTTSATKRPEICITKKHLKKFKPIKPGTNSWSSSVKRGKPITILSDSMLQRINRREFNECLDHGHASFKCYPGGKPNDMAWNMIPQLIEECPDSCVVHSGTNRLKRYDQEIVSNETIAK